MVCYAHLLLYDCMFLYTHFDISYFAHLCFPLCYSEQLLTHMHTLELVLACVCIIALSSSYMLSAMTMCYPRCAVCIVVHVRGTEHNFYFRYRIGKYAEQTANIFIFPQIAPRTPFSLFLFCFVLNRKKEKIHEHNGITIVITHTNKHAREQYPTRLH